MSLGLFTVDTHGHLWFDIDCHLSNPTWFFPKHFVFNRDSGLSRILLLHTAYLLHVHNAANELLNIRPVNSAQQVAEDIQEVIKALPCGEHAFARVVGQGLNGWEYFELSLDGLSGPHQAETDKLYGVGVGWDIALCTWNATNQLAPCERLRAALQAAANVRPDVVVPHTRQPARIDRCMKSWAYPSELLS